MISLGACSRCRIRAGVRLKRGHGAFGEALWPQIVLAAGGLEEMTDEQRDVGRPLAQRRHVNRDDIETEVQVPRSACSNLPTCFSVAPVKDPFSCPKSSDSMRSSGIAAQFTWMNRSRVLRELR